MKQLNKENIEYLVNLINTINPARFTSVIIDELGARAMDETGTVAMMGTNVPEFPGAMGLTRVPQLKARMDLVLSRPNFTVEAFTNEERGFVERLAFKANGVKANYRAGNPESIRAPKKLMDKMVVDFELDASIASELQSAVGAYTATELRFKVSDTLVAAEVDDGNGDIFSTHVAKTEYEEDLTHVYDATNVSQLLKLSLNNGKVKVQIGERGILSIHKDPFTFYVMPSKRG